MNNFIVSARKYRPTNFKTVIGQDYIVTTLKNAIKNNQLAQAFLFTGPRGVGKTTCARILAKTINCTNISPDYEACDVCNSCKSFNLSTSFNVYELDAASNNSVDDIRSLVEQVRIPPQAGLYKIYIIDEVHMLSTAAFNAFLKTLEEPPSYAKFILATTEKHKIIPTILSRCQVFDFKRIKVEDITNHLMYVAKNENIEAEAEALHVIASKSDGALRDALSTFDQLASYTTQKITYKDVIENLNILDYDYHFKIVNFCLNNNIPSVLLILNEIYEKGFDGQAVITGLSSHLRNLLICKDESTLPLLELHERIIEEYKEQSKISSLKFLISALDIINKCDIGYKTTSNKRFHLELAILRIANLIENQNKVAENVINSPRITEQETNKPVINSPNIVNTSSPASNNLSNQKENNSSNRTEISENSQNTNQTSVKTNVSNGNSALYGLSIKNMQSINENIAKESNLGEESYTDEMFYNTWNEFILSIKDKSESDYAYFKTLNPERVEGDNFSLKISLRIQYQLATEMNISSYFQKKLNNVNIKIEPILAVSEQDVKVQTKENLFKEVISADKDLVKFIKDLDLHLET